MHFLPPAPQSSDIQGALVDFENIISMEPRNYVGDNMSRVTPMYPITQYNVACCYSMLNQARAGTGDWLVQKPCATRCKCYICSFDTVTSARRNR